MKIKATNRLLCTVDELKEVLDKRTSRRLQATQVSVDIPQDTGKEKEQ